MKETETQIATAKEQHWSSSISGPIILIGILFVVAIFVSWHLTVVIISLIAILIIHEYGHFWVARRAGMKVTDLALGFGPKLWSVRRGEVLYSLRAIPLGAFVRVPGMYMIEKPTADLEEDRSYRQQPFRSRVLFAAAGPATHFVLAFFLLFSMFTFIGYGGINFSPDQVENWAVGKVNPGTPAAQAGIMVGDRIVAVNGQEVKSFENLATAHIAPNPSRRVTITVRRDGQNFDLQPVQLEFRRRNSASGSIEAYGFLGVGSPTADHPKSNPASAVLDSFREIGVLAKEIVVGTGRVLAPSSISGFVGDTFNQDDNTQTVSQSDASSNNVPNVQTGTPTVQNVDDTSPDSNRLLSLIGIAQAGEGAVNNSLLGAFSFFVFLNLFLGVLNLLPVLPFDGGHVVIAIYERIRSRRKVKYHADISKMLYLGTSLFVLLLLVNVVAIFRDITDPFSF